MSYRVEPEAMTGVRGGARGYGVRARGYGNLKSLVSAPGPLGLIGVLNWDGLGWGWA